MKKVIRSLILHMVKSGKRIAATTQKPEVRNWIRDKGDKVLRLNYDLNENSVVFDLGGYEGQWASDIYSKYRCKIYVFEPSGIYCKEIQNRFRKNSDIKVFQFGLSNRDSEEKLFMAANASSTLKATKGDFEIIKFKDFIGFVDSYGIDSIDLIKINIEGGEYDLLDYIIEKGYHLKIKNIQVQFHDFVPNYENRFLQIQKNLSVSHKITYQYKFLWENWLIKD